MSRPELHRLEVLTRLTAGSLDQLQAARELGLSDRQVRRLLCRFRHDGVAGLVHAARGRPSRRRLDPELVNAALSLVAQHYADFGPTFANEKLRALHGLQLSTESLRQAMIAAQLWTPKRMRRRRLHPPRERRPRFGELLQLDGSPHDWFEGRAPRCSLLVIIDDATSRLTGLHFAPAETTWAYFTLLRQSITRYGRPLALYSDRHSIFRAPNGLNTPAQTQLGRALEQLDIELICANSPQAKGRVERANNTLQRRLVREMRLRNISSIEDANAYLPHFIQAHNQRFAQAPALEQDVHRSANTFELDAILAVRYERTLSKDCTVQVQRDVYLVDDPAVRRGMRVTVIEQANRGFQLRLNDTTLHCRRLRSLTEQGQIRDAKSLNEHLDRRQRATMPQMARTIPANHPWRSFRLPGSPPPT